MAKPKPDRPKCEHEMPRSPRHPVGDLPCGRWAKQRANIGNDTWINVCGTHAKYWRVRRHVIIPIITIADSDPTPALIGEAHPAEHGKDGHRCSGFCPNYSKEPVQ